MNKGHVISDLHMFAERSDVERHQHAIEEAAIRGDFLILNGDIVDFKWSTIGSIEDTVDAAGLWLRRLITHAPECRIVHVLGNHDNLTPYTELLDTLAKEHESFEWHPTHYQVGDSLFLHGDLAMGRERHHPEERELHMSTAVKTQRESSAYRWLIASRVHQAARILHPPKKTARNIYRSLRMHTPHKLQTIRHVYTGHTHVPYRDIEIDGIRFHNTGTAVRHSKLELHEVIPTHDTSA